MPKATSLAYMVVIAAAACGALAHQDAAADTLIIDGLNQAQATAGERPSGGMTMDKVTAKWGAPVNKAAAVGKPPITRWEYSAFNVYFEYDHVIHSVLKHGA